MRELWKNVCLLAMSRNFGTYFSFSPVNSGKCKWLSSQPGLLSTVEDERTGDISWYRECATWGHFFQEVITGVPVARFKKSRCQMKDMDIVFPGVCPKFL